MGWAPPNRGRCSKVPSPSGPRFEWDEAQPGFREIDLVVHCGTTTCGESLHSLTVTEVATGWTEWVALRTRGQQAVFQALVVARGRLPFPFQGIDSANGSAFLDAHQARLLSARSAD